MKGKVAFDAERALWKSHLANAERSYNVMCSAHAQLVERERAYVREASDLRCALLTIFHDTKDDTARRVAAAALGIRMPEPFPKRRRARKA